MKLFYKTIGTLLWQWKIYLAKCKGEHTLDMSDAPPTVLDTLESKGYRFTVAFWYIWVYTERNADNEETQ